MVAGGCVVAGGHAWFAEGCAWLPGVHGCGGHVWLWGDVVARGVCMVARGHVWLLAGACVVAGVCVVYRGMHGCGGHAWLWGCPWLQGGVHRA